MKIPFVKMHGAGNDFVIVDARKLDSDFSQGELSALCNRRRGIGADGLILVLESYTADFRMRYFNSDGREANLCGNGARCVARFAYDHGIAGREMKFETEAGIVGARIDGRLVRVSLGNVQDVKLDLSLEGIAHKVHFGICGVPHAVILDPHAAKMTDGEFVAFAQRIRNHRAFGAAGANVNLVSVRDRRSFFYRTYERGVEAETQACGTGAAVISAILAHLGMVDRSIECETSGGDRLLVDLDFDPSCGFEVYLAGPAEVSFYGTFCREAYQSK